MTLEERIAALEDRALADSFAPPAGLLTSLGQLINANGVARNDVMAANTKTILGAYTTLFANSLIIVGVVGTGIYSAAGVGTIGATVSSSTTFSPVGAFGSNHQTAGTFNAQAMGGFAMQRQGSPQTVPPGTVLDMVLSYGAPCVAEVGVSTANWVLLELP